MDDKFLTTLMYFSAIMGIAGLVYLIFGFFIGGLRFNTVWIRGAWARVFGLCYIILALPLFAFTFGTKQVPDADWYQWLSAYVNASNYYFWLIGWVVILLILHIISGFMGNSD